jgi:SPP1 family predicted phage head-tail adaptor
MDGVSQGVGMKHDCRTRDKLVRIEKLIGQTTDAHGQVDQTTNANWGQHCSAWCSVVSKGGREFWKVQQTNADVSHVWTADWSPELADASPAMRLIHEGNTYEILSVIDIDLNHMEIEIQTKRAV